MPVGRVTVQQVGHSPSFAHALAVVAVQFPLPRRRAADEGALGPAGSAGDTGVVFVAHHALDPALLAGLAGPGRKAGRG